MTTEESACSALARLKKRKSCHNIVIADIDMPEMEIFEFVRKVRHECTSIPVICKLNRSFFCLSLQSDIIIILGFNLSPFRSLLISFSICSNCWGCNNGIRE